MARIVQQYVAASAGASSASGALYAGRRCAPAGWSPRRIRGERRDGLPHRACAGQGCEPSRANSTSWLRPGSRSLQALKAWATPRIVWGLRYAGDRLHRCVRSAFDHLARTRYDRAFL